MDITQHEIMRQKIRLEVHQRARKDCPGGYKKQIAEAKKSIKDLQGKVKHERKNSMYIFDCEIELKITRKVMINASTQGRAELQLCSHIEDYVGNPKNVGELLNSLDNFSHSDQVSIKNVGVISQGKKSQKN